MIHEDTQCSVIPRRNPEPSKGLIEEDEKYHNW